MGKARLRGGKIVCCKHCKLADEVTLAGHNRKGIQKYHCGRCKILFLDNEALPRMHIPVKAVVDILCLFYSGMSSHKICIWFNEKYGYMPSKTTVYRYISKFTNIALMSNQKDIIVKDWTNRQVWFEVMEEELVRTRGNLVKVG